MSELEDIPEVPKGGKEGSQHHDGTKDEHICPACSTAELPLLVQTHAGCSNVSCRMKKIPDHFSMSGGCITSCLGLRAHGCNTHLQLRLQSGTGMSQRGISQ